MITYNPAIVTARAQTLKTVLEAGGGNATLKLYPAPIPAPGGSTTATALLSFSLPPGIAAADGLTITGIVPALAAESGVPIWGRIADSAGVFVADVDVGDQHSGAAIAIQVDAGPSGNVQVYAGAIVTLASLHLA